MFRGLKDLFEGVLAAPTETHPASVLQRLQLATAVLLVEVMHADGHVRPPQQRAVVRALQRQFRLSEGDTALLVQKAEQAQHDATDFFAFTTALNDQLDVGEKLQVVEAMWQVAYADGTLEAHEQHVLWRVADLLHVPHGAYINAKMRAKAAATGHTA